MLYEVNIMTITKKLTFEEYLTLTGTELEERVELIDGELVELPPEAWSNDDSAMFFFLKLVEAGIPFQQIKVRCELQTPVLERDDAANRYPDLIVVQDVHRSNPNRRMTITLKMPPPRFVLEVVSPGKTNRDRDYIRKRAQYAAVGIPEYVIVDPQEQIVVVLILENGSYREDGCYRDAEVVQSTEFPMLHLTAGQILSAGQPRSSNV
jgi:Uma2 family endonuclease